MRYSAAKRGEQDFELNIASIIDCFTVVVTYLLVSASFISLGALDVSALTQRPAGDTTPEPTTTLSIRIARNHDLSLQLDSPAGSQVTELVSKGGQLDRKAMLEKLVELKRQWPALDAAVVSASGETEYEDLVRVVESTKKLIPSVMLGERLD